jgi:hypothetical protein
MDQGNNGLSRGDRNRNARLAALRVVLPFDHAILGIDLAQSRQRLSWPITIRGCWRGGGRGARRGSWVSCWTGRCARRWRRGSRGSRWRASRPGTGVRPLTSLTGALGALAAVYLALGAQERPAARLRRVREILAEGAARSGTMYAATDHRFGVADCRVRRPDRWMQISLIATATENPTSRAAPIGHSGPTWADRAGDQAAAQIGGDGRTAGWEHDHPV